MSKIKYSKKFMTLVVTGAMVASGAPKTVFAATPETTKVSTTTNSSKLTTEEYMALVEKAANSDKIEDFLALGIYSPYTHKPILEGATQEEFLEFKKAANTIYNFDTLATVENDYLTSEDVKAIKLYSAVMAGVKPENIIIEWRTDNQLEGANASWIYKNGINEATVYINEAYKTSDKAGFVLIYFVEFEEFGPLILENKKTTSQLWAFSSIVKAEEVLNAYKEKRTSKTFEYSDTPSISLCVSDLYTLTNFSDVSMVKRYIETEKDASKVLIKSNFVQDYNNTINSAVSNGQWTEVKYASMPLFSYFTYKGQSGDINSLLKNDYNALSNSKKVSYNEFCDQQMKEHGQFVVEIDKLNNFILVFKERNIGNRILVGSALVPEINTKFKTLLPSLLEKDIDVKMEKGVSGCEEEVVSSKNVTTTTVISNVNDNYIKSEFEKHKNSFDFSDITFNDYLNILYEEYARPYGYTFENFVTYLKTNNIITNDINGSKVITAYDIAKINVKLVEHCGVKLKSIKYPDIPGLSQLPENQQSIWIKACNGNLLYDAYPNETVTYTIAIKIAETTLQYEKNIDEKFKLKLTNKSK